MSPAEAKAAAKDTEALAVIERQKKVRAFLEHVDVAAEIERALPPGLKFERMMRVIATAVSSNPKLALSTRRSLMASVIQCAQLGLEPDGYLGQAYLIPYRNGKLSREQGRDVFECQLQLGYRGLMELAYRSGKVISISAEVVGRDDKFHVQKGSDARIMHEPKIDSGDRDLTGEPVSVVAAYAVAKLKGGGELFEVVNIRELDALQVTAQEKSGKDTPWLSHFNEMCRKTAVRRLAKRLPLSPEFTRAAVMDEYHETGITHPPVIEVKLPPGAPDLDEPVTPAPEAKPEESTEPEPEAMAEESTAAEPEASAKLQGDLEPLFDHPATPSQERKTIRIRYQGGKAILSGATYLVKSQLETKFKARFDKDTSEWKMAQSKTPEFLELCEKHSILIVAEENAKLWQEDP